MQAERYSEKSFAVFGDTKPWATNLKNLGGGYNGNLGGRPGWIFPNNREPEVMNFLAMAAAGQVQPLGTARAPTQVAQLVPQTYAQPAMTPQAAFQQLQQRPLSINQPMLPQMTPLMMQPGALPQMTQINSIPMPSPQVIRPQTTGPLSPQIPRPLTPQPVTVLPAQPTQIGFPNLFTAADGLTYQIIVYTVTVPRVGQRITLNLGDQTVEYVVTSLRKDTAPYDDILISRQVEETSEVSRAVVTAGKWQIFGLNDEHTLTFHA